MKRRVSSMDREYAWCQSVLTPHTDEGHPQDAEKGQKWLSSREPRDHATHARRVCARCVAREHDYRSALC